MAMMIRTVPRCDRKKKEIFLYDLNIKAFVTMNHCFMAIVAYIENKYSIEFKK